MIVRRYAKKEQQSRSPLSQTHVFEYGKGETENRSPFALLPYGKGS
jgi:hypothetical protein